MARVEAEIEAGVETTEEAMAARPVRLAGPGEARQARGMP